MASPPHGSTETMSVAALLDQLAVAILQVTQTGRDHFYLYVEIEPGVTAPSFFQVVGDCLVYTDTTHEMGELMYDLWLAADPGERRRALRFEMIGGWHKAEFDLVHPPGAPELPLYGDGDDDYNPNSIEEEDRRMMAALRTRFGEGMEIIYPSTTRRPLQIPLDVNGTKPFGPA